MRIWDAEQSLYSTWTDYVLTLLQNSDLLFDLLFAWFYVAFPNVVGRRNFQLFDIITLDDLWLTYAHLNI